MKDKDTVKPKGASLIASSFTVQANALVARDAANAAVFD